MQQGNLFPPRILDLLRKREEQAERGGPEYRSVDELMAQVKERRNANDN